MKVQTRKSDFGTAMSQRFLRVSSKLGLSGHPAQIYIMLAASFLFSLGRNIAFPYLAMFLNGKIQDGGLGFDSSLVGFMIMIGGLSSTFALLVTGSLCDKFGRRRMMMLSIIPQTILTAGFAYAHAYSEFLLLYAASGVIGAFFDPAYSAMVADLVQPESREQVYGMSYMIGNVGTVIGPPVGGIIASLSGYSVLFLYAAFLAAGAAVAITLLVKETQPASSSYASFSQFAGIFRHRIFIVFCLLGALTSFVYSQLYGLLSVYTQYVGFEPYVFGIFFSVNGLMVVLLQIPLRLGTMRIGAAKSFIIAQTLYALGFTSFMFATSFLQFLTGVIVLTLGEIIFVPASSAFVANIAPADMRGRYMAMAGLFFGIGSSAGSQIAFSIYGALSTKQLTWGILGIIGFATSIGYVLMWKMAGTKKKPAVGNKETCP
jgi:MFS family permease